MNSKKMFSALLISIFINACSGSGGTNAAPTSNQYPWNSFSVTAASDLPTCSGDIVGRLYYIESSNTFQVCKSTGWTSINVKGNDGTNGSNGITITNIKTCSKISGSSIFKHNIVTYSSNDKFVFCSISDTLSTFSNSNFYLSTQTGSTNEGCILTYDIDTASAGFWHFTLSDSTRTAVYNDSASASNGTTITFASGDCTTVP